eukprot:CAMPEP_0197697764 /NCGR_PEP_ID=MMETSP1338-20131121/118392_1 /TAXON_ID=43686 ORGANISM="Pelagodinium beii, Strain RCC1491" /NCGR_SAMPLE_ID=MMETSP1338 /ASSEMBLY_ACC=CAM_ASM_000754 /LENGTH=178 /DNA_ID=CAMNT_0043281041 /DNA_START=23 /DNA_END=555 /DNA_ORIENTATION=+
MSDGQKPRKAPSLPPRKSWAADDFAKAAERSAKVQVVSKDRPMPGEIVTEADLEELGLDASSLSGPRIAHPKSLDNSEPELMQEIIQIMDRHSREVQRALSAWISRAELRQQTPKPSLARVRSVEELVQEHLASELAAVAGSREQAGDASQATAVVPSDKAQIPAPKAEADQKIQEAA